MLLGLGAISALLRGAPATTPTPVASEATRASAGPTPSVVVAVPSPTPTLLALPATPTAALAPAATATPAGVAARVGQRVELGGIALTANAVKRAARLEGPGGMALTPPEAGHEYVLVDVTVENTQRDKAPYNPLYFKVRDAEGFEYTATLTLDSSALKSGDLAKGERVRGTVAFSVPTGRTPLMLTYEPLVILGGYETIRILLD